MQTTRRRTDPRLAGITRALVTGGAVFAGLNAAGSAPTGFVVAVAAVAGVISYLVADLGVLVAIAALSLPLLAVSPVIGIGFLVIGVAGVRYLGADGGRAFLVVAVAVAGAFLGPAWAGVALAGFLLGAGEGALAAGVACVVVQAVGIGLGLDTVGPTLVGADRVLIDTARMPDSLLQLSWVADSLRTIDANAVDATVDAVVSVRHPIALFVQPLVWATGAALTGVIAREGRARHHLLITLVSLVVGVVVTAAATGALVGSVETAITSGGIAMAFATSVMVAVVAGAVYERFFVREAPVVPTNERRSAMNDEDADVDELLTLIATAEEKLATKHTTHRTVLITDMKSFSRMTEEEGSMVTAKAIQRHRDLLLPLVEQHRGHGKSTGGDGLIAAFEAPEDALRSAVAMQRALAAHNQAHPSERELTVRIGIADGEVVLDKGGRPFIGAAINVAARVMNLADGGQAYAVASLTRGSDIEMRPLGAFELKNIAQPVDVVELTW